MPELNCDIPVFECLVRNEFLYNFQRGHGEFTKAAVFGAASVPGRAVGFHCLLDNGACYGRLPIHALVWAAPGDAKDVSELQLWDCPSENVSCIVYDFLKESRCHVLLPSGEQNGTYMFTLDWHGSTYAENAGALGWKSAHFIRLDSGYFALQPNNRILWECPAFVKKLEKPDYALTERIWKCEGGGTTTDEYFYKMEKAREIDTNPWEGGAGEGSPAWVTWESCSTKLAPIPFTPSTHTNHIVDGKTECRYCLKNTCECTEFRYYPPTTDGLGPNFRILNGHPTCDNCSGRSHGCYCTAGKKVYGEMP